MNNFAPSSRFVCSHCIRHISRSSALFSRPRLRAQSTTPSQDAIPNSRLRIHKHWKEDGRAPVREDPPVRDSLHLSKTKGIKHLELGKGQQPRDGLRGGSAISLRNKRQRMQEAQRKKQAMPTDRVSLPGKVRRKLRSQLAHKDLEGGENISISSELGATPISEPVLESVTVVSSVPPLLNRRERRKSLQKGKKKGKLVEELRPSEPSPPLGTRPNTERASLDHVDTVKMVKRKQQKFSKRGRNELAEELQPSKPSPPLGARSRTDDAPTISSEAPLNHVKLHFNNLEDFNWYWETFPPTIAQKTQANHFFTNHGKSAKLLTSVAQFREFPDSDVPEVAFVGRSNVGKSSLLNAVVNADIKALLARTSSTPGFTKTMNLYGLGAGNGVTMKKRGDGHVSIIGRSGLTIVDMPGYGEGSLASWGVEIMKYIQKRKQLRRVFVLIDAEHGIKDKDRSLLASLRLAGVSHQVVLSKLDKIYIPQAKTISSHFGKSLRRLVPKGTHESLRRVMEKLKNEIQPPVGGGALGEVLGVSAKTLVDGKMLGIDHVRFAIIKAAGLDAMFKFDKDVSTPWSGDEEHRRRRRESRTC